MCFPSLCIFDNSNDTLNVLQYVFRVSFHLVLFRVYIQVVMPFHPSESKRFSIVVERGVSQILGCIKRNKTVSRNVSSSACVTGSLLFLSSPTPSAVNSFILLSRNIHQRGCFNIFQIVLKSPSKSKSTSFKSISALAWLDRTSI